MPCVLACSVLFPPRLTRAATTHAHLRFACYDAEYTRNREARAAAAAGGGGGAAADSRRSSALLSGGGAAIARRAPRDPDLAPAVSTAVVPLDAGRGSGSRSAAAVSRGRAADAADEAAVRALR